jgi:signal transduction histidine kinase
VWLQHLAQRAALEQLASEFAPQVLSQHGLRRLALSAAISGVRDRLEPEEIAAALAVPGNPRLAYRHWAAGELFHAGFKSSLEFYGPDGRPLSRFAFDIPPLEEAPLLPDEPWRTPQVREEWLGETVALQQRLLHAELPLYHGGRLVAVVIGHVLDEPHNLPFLPWSLPYLAALGPGGPPHGVDGVGGSLHYVAYDAGGSVDLTTLLQPPADARALRAAAGSGRPVETRAGGEPYVGLALSDEGGRVHVLLVPQRTALESVAAAVRMSLFCLLVAAALALPRWARPGAAGRLLRFLQGSFYRKLLAALLLASVVPLLGLALFLRGYVERRGAAAVISRATYFVRTAQRVVEDYAAQRAEGEPAELNDAILHWLRRVVGQEIHVYDRGRLLATSKRELFDSGLLPERLDGAVQHDLAEGGLPYVVAPLAVGPTTIPVAYAPGPLVGEAPGRLVLAVQMVLEQRQIERWVARFAEMILLVTVALVGLLAGAAALLARTVARPVRELVGATDRIAAGDYAARLEPKTRDEIAELVRGFNAMASALARQRADLERRRDYTETLLRHATTAVLSLDAAGRLVTLNPAATGLLAPCAPLRPGADLLAALEGCPELAPLGRILRAAPTGEPLEVDLIRDHAARRHRAVRVELPRVSGESFGTLILLDDVTELMRSNQLAAWAEMARAIAHEIKNPLTPIQLSAEHLGRLLHDRGVSLAPEEQACLATIARQVRALYEIAGEFSTFAKLPALAPEPTDPVALMRSTAAPYRAAPPAGIVIEERYEPAPPIAADRRVLSRALVNLIENALQAMPEGGTLALGVRRAEDGRVELAVADTGPGLEPAVRRRLFEPYFSTKSSGTGLGLAIARRAAEAHGGTIEVETGRGHGTVFRLRLPAILAG